MVPAVEDTNGAVTTAVRRHPVATFVVLAFAWTWTYDLVVFLVVGESPGRAAKTPSTWGPLLAAGVVTSAIGGDVREWAGQVKNWRVTPRWYLVALGVPVLFSELEPLLHLLAGGSIAPRDDSFVSFFLLFAAGTAHVAFLAGGLEEFGWRGFAQPRLQEGHTAVAAGTVIGIVWACWHLPLFFLFDLSPYDRFLPFLIGITGFSLFLTRLYNDTGGSVLLVLLSHGIHDQASFFETRGRVAGPEWLRVVIDQSHDLAYFLPVAALLAVYGGRYLASRGPIPRIPGSPH